MIGIPGSLLFSTKEEWRSWLEANHLSEKEVWLVFYKKSSGKPRIPYEDAVEEALCFGWIDSLVQSLDEEKYVQKFTPRKPESKWSLSNIRRMEKLIREGRMTPAGLLKFNELETHPERIVRERVTPETVMLPDDLEMALEQNSTAKISFNGFTVAYKTLCIRWIDSAKRPVTRSKRIAEVVSLSARGLKIGLK
jgi:uncharacterized protein YdeI (YjbR/CyaY-like superfamily)